VPRLSNNSNEDGSAHSKPKCHSSFTTDELDSLVRKVEVLQPRRVRYKLSKDAYTLVASLANADGEKSDRPANGGGTQMFTVDAVDVPVAGGVPVSQHPAPMILECQ